jgi:peptidoglycan hydrolase-like protein with peptidoglycan-binding domain/DNA invertase Pin-like site-specific DNA recombinase
MRTTYWVPGARRRSFGLVAGLALLCLAGTMVAGSPARAAQAPTAESGLLTSGDGYAQPRGSTRVRALQRRLRTLGLRPGPVDGLFGPRTKAAVESFQNAVGLQVDGIIGPHTRHALRRASAPLLGRGTGYGEPGGSLQVRRLQRQLRRLDLRPGPIDGLYGPRTTAAVARFQRARHRTPDGVAWFRTRRAIASARRAVSDPFTGESRPRTVRTSGSRAESRPAGDPPKESQLTHHTARGPGALTARTKEAGELPSLALVGVLAFMLVALAAPLARRVAIATAGATPRLGTAPRLGTSALRDRPSSSSSDPPPLRAAPDPSERKRTVAEAVGYITVTESADGAKQELRRQITAMDAVCEHRGWRLVEVARDIGDTSRTPFDRPGLTYALERLVGSEVSCLVVAELRRLGGSAAELGGVLRWLRDRGLRLVAVDVDLDTESADGRIAADALISVGERGTQPDGRGMPTSQPGADAGGGRPGRQAVRDLPELQEHIRAMRSAGMTLQAIADRLNEEGVPTVRGGREWRPSSVQVAAGYRRPRRLTSGRGVYDWREQRRRREDP